MSSIFHQELEERFTFRTVLLSKKGSTDPRRTPSSPWPRFPVLWKVETRCDVPGFGFIIRRTFRSAAMIFSTRPVEVPHTGPAGSANLCSERDSQVLGICCHSACLGGRFTVSLGIWATRKTSLSHHPVCCVDGLMGFCNKRQTKKRLTSS